MSGVEVLSEHKFKMAEKNYYIILEVKTTATFEDIKSAYRILAKKYHPDKNIGNKAAEESFKEIQQAYAVLSNPEKRRKYDLKISYGTRTQAQQKTNSGGPQYTGNAYQYAQQQAQYKQQQAYSQTQKRPSYEPEKKTEKENWQILVSVGIALVLLYFIISYSTEKTIATNVSSVPTAENTIEPEVPINESTISNYDSPYTSYFGEEIYDEQSKNSIAFLNGSKSEAVVCLVEKNAPYKTIRNIYMNSETEIKMNQIPDGEYFLKIYYGTDWSIKKTFLNETIKGGFEKENSFLKLNDGDDALVMKKEKKGSLDSYSMYEIKIGPDNKQNAKTISAEAFFKK